MLHLTRSIVLSLAFALQFLNLASAASALPPLTLVSQQFVSAAPATLADAFEGSLLLQFEAPWNWQAFGLSVWMKPGDYYFGVSGSRAWTSDNYPADLDEPEFTQANERLTITIPNVNVLAHDSFSIAARLSSPPSNQFPAWSRFPNDLTAAVTIDTRLLLADALARPPAGDHASLQSWIEALLSETLQRLGPGAVATIGVEYAYAVTTLPVTAPTETEVSVPIFLGSGLPYSPSLSAELAERITRWIDANQPTEKKAYLKFQLSLFSDPVGQKVPKLRFNDLRLRREQF
ncbi:MAG: hypothetical protein NDJ90_04980 [Oligoflexia bacterium]|nr:hypothetical protein [Oligoflexia bacterium]